MNDYVADTRQQLAQLNRLEDQLKASRIPGKGSLDDEALIASLRANIPLGVLVHHDRLRTRGRKSVAEVRHGVCSGCHIGLPIGTVNALKHQSELVKCNTCGRYIFIAEDELAPPVSPEPAKEPSQHDCSNCSAGPR